MKFKSSSRNTLLAAIISTIALVSAAGAQTRAYQVSDRQIQTLLERIESNTDLFRAEYDNAPSSDAGNGNVRSDRAGTLIANFENATDNLRNNFTARRSTSADVQEVLNQSYPLNTFVRNNRQTADAQAQWTRIRSDIDLLAGYYRVATAWNDSVRGTGDQGGLTVSDAQLRSTVARIRTRERSFRTAYDSWARYGGRNRTDAGEVMASITEFETAINDLNVSLNDRNRQYRGVEQLLRPSTAINSYLGSNRTTSSVTSKWTLVRNDLNTLAGYYRVSWDWNAPVVQTGGQSGGIDSRLTGTFRLNVGQSDTISTAVERAVASANYQENQRDRVRRVLERRLASPETLSIEKRGRQVTMSSTNAAAVTLQADGVAQTETSANGRTVNVTVTATERDLTINYEGDRMNDYFVSFASVRNDQLRVTRRVNLEAQGQTVTVTSVYDRTDRTPNWNTTVIPVGNNGNTQDRFLVTNNTTIVARLDGPLSTRSSRDGDRFSMTITSPSEYNGAVIEGSVTGQPSGVVSGRANMSLTFENIRLADGRRYRFAGIVEQVRGLNGNTVNVNNEGSIRDSSQTNKTVVRAGVGAVIGAIIGAIAGGGQGAAIGAGVGAGAGAGTVVLQGRDNLDLGAGSEFTITATSPASTASRN